MQRLTAKKAFPDDQAAQLAGRLLTDADYDTVIRDDTIVLKEDGTPLLIYCKGVIALADCQAAYPALKVAAEDGSASNRAVASGNMRVRGAEGFGVVSQDGSTVTLYKRDGTLSKTHQSLSSEVVINRIKEKGGVVEQQLSSGEWMEIEPRLNRSGVAGYLDNGGNRFPYCRLTAFNINHPDQFARALPMVRTVDRVFQERIPERYAAQRAVVENTVDDYVISGTSFTTITINLNFQTAVHKDAGDLKEGFGVMSAMRRGKFDGCYTCFPQYRICADMQTGDVLLADVHEWHGNTPLKPRGAYERMGLIFYYREKMQECGTPTEELEKARHGKR